MRTSGILMPVFSLPSPYGIGTFGKEAYRFVDFLEKAGQTYWQILPLNPTNYGDSPYQSFSSYAGNPYFIDPEMLIEEGLLTKEEADSFDFGKDIESVDYGKLYCHREDMLKIAFSRFKKTEEYEKFVAENAFWLDSFSLFMTIKKLFGDTAWYTWEKPFKEKQKETIDKVKEEYFDILEFYRFQQFKFSEQWFSLKAYANSKGIKIIGDMPIYVSFDSADVFENPEQFLLDKNLKPKKVAGCPPDAFSEDGQLWGNPIYNWKLMKEEKYAWWKNRIGYALTLYDVLRIDHFRGFEAYYTIPFGEETAINGKWVKGPGIAFFEELKKKFGKDMPIIAEDLGLLTPAVKKMLYNTGFPGMKVLQFAFDTREESDYLPHNYNTNCVVYTGTHDNDTIMGWLKSASPDDVEHAHRYLNCPNDEGFNWAMIKAALMSVADTAIIMMPDLMGMGSEGRINTPSTLGGNWIWRVRPECINDWLAEIVLKETCTYGRKSQ